MIDQIQNRKGYVQVYTGEGKGKTTAALGLTLRAIGAGKKVFIGQFAKGKIYSEIKAIEKFLPNVTTKQYGLECFIENMPSEEDLIMARQGLEEVKHIIQKNEYDIVILDEACIALLYNLYSLDEILEIIEHKPMEMELIFTGRYAPYELIQKADLVTEMREVKHYFRRGVIAREGIEY